MHDTYTFLRHLADSWVLLAMVLFFVGAILFAWRPGSRALHEAAGQVPFRHDDRPLADPAPVLAPVMAPVRLKRVPACGQDCGDCTCDLIPEGRI
jgi:cytochrome c oxidase cbb3-type subunit 4